MLVLSIQCVVAHQCLKLRVPKLKLISHVLHQFLTFNNIYYTTSQHYLSVLPLKMVLTLDEPQKKWEAGTQKRLFKEEGVGIDYAKLWDIQV